jgi:hypothetical protein
MSIQVPNVVAGDCGSKLQLIIMIKAYTAGFYRYLISLLLSEMIKGE